MHELKTRRGFAFVAQMTKGGSLYRFGGPAPIAPMNSFSRQCEIAVGFGFPPSGDPRCPSRVNAEHRTGFSAA